MASPSRRLTAQEIALIELSYKLDTPCALCGSYSVHEVAALMQSISKRPVNHLVVGAAGARWEDLPDCPCVAEVVTPNCLRTASHTNWLVVVTAFPWPDLTSGLAEALPRS